MLILQEPTKHGESCSRHGLSCQSCLPKGDCASYHNCGNISGVGESHSLKKWIGLDHPLIECGMSFSRQLMPWGLLWDTFRLGMHAPLDSEVLKGRAAHRGHASSYAT